MMIFLFSLLLQSHAIFTPSMGHESVLQIVCSTTGISETERHREYVETMDLYLHFARKQNPMVYEYIQISKRFTDSNTSNIKAVCSYVLLSRQTYDSYKDDCSSITEEMNKNNFQCSRGGSTYYTVNNITDLNQLYDQKARCLYKLALEEKLDLRIVEIEQNSILEEACLTTRTNK